MALYSKAEADSAPANGSPACPSLSSKAEERVLVLAPPLPGSGKPQADPILPRPWGPGTEACQLRPRGRKPQEVADFAHPTSALGEEGREDWGIWGPQGAAEMQSAGETPSFLSPAGP